MEKEKWKDIIGYKKLYQISNYGKVKNLKRKINTWYGTRIIKEKILKEYSKNKGYTCITLSKNNIHKTKNIHRLVAIHFIVNKDNKPHINHIDGNKLNNHYKNLEWCTYKENMKHAIKNNLVWRGEQVKCSKLKNNDIIKIRKLYKLKKYNTITLAKKYNMHQSTIWDIVNYKTWKHIKE